MRYAEVILVMGGFVVFVVCVVRVATHRVRPDARTASRARWTMTPVTLEDGRRQIVLQRVWDARYANGTDMQVFCTLPARDLDDMLDSEWENAKLAAEQECSDWNAVLKRQRT